MKMSTLEGNMNSTPESLKSKPISKSLLTPCRRPGLSRKIKTPLNMIQKQEYSPIAKTTPEKYKPPDVASEEFQTKIEGKTVKNPSRTNKKRSTSNQDVYEKRTVLKQDNEISKLKELSVKICSGINSFNENDIKAKVSENVDFNKVKVKDSSSADNFASEEVKQKITKKADINKVKVTDYSSHSDSDSLSSSQSNKSNRSKLKLLSMKKTSTSQDKFDENKYPPSDYKDSNGTEDSELPRKGKKRSAPKSDEEDLKYVEDSTNIEEIKRRIKIKEARFEELKHAAIYAKLHNVENLQKLTTVWKVGCKQALIHLFKQLQGHGHIEMTTLLRKFNIPESIMTINDCDN